MTLTIATEDRDGSSGVFRMRGTLAGRKFAPGWHVELLANFDGENECRDCRAWFSMVRKNRQRPSCLLTGLALAWTARASLDDANTANRNAAEQQGRAAARAIACSSRRSTRSGRARSKRATARATTAQALRRRPPAGRSRATRPSSHAGRSSPRAPATRTKSFRICSNDSDASLRHSPPDADT